MSNEIVTDAPTERGDQPDEIELPAFRTMARGYKFVFTRLPVFVRMGWLDFVYSAILFVVLSFAPEIFGPRAQAMSFHLVSLPLMGFFVLRFAVRCHQYSYRELRAHDRKIQGLEFDGESALPYAWLFLICAAILAAPFALLFALFFLVDVGEAAIWPLAIVVTALDFYLAGRMSVLFAQTALIGTLPPRWTWNISTGVVWKLIVIIALAPWPFNVAIKLLDKLSDRLDALWSLPILVLTGAISFLGVAVLATILSDAYWHCLQRNHDMIKEQAKRSGDA